MGITDTIARIRTGLGEDSPHIADLKELESGINTVKQTLSIRIAYLMTQNVI